MNKVSLVLPENISEITLRQFLRHEELQTRDLDSYNFNKRKIEIFTGIPFKSIDNIRGVDAERILKQIDTALATECEFVNTFKMHDMEFGFIPNLDKMTLGEYADLSKHGVDKDSLHNLMAVLFRPVVKRNKDKYEIAVYNGTEEYAEMMKDMPLHVVNGALVFFYNLANELQQATQKFLSEELQRETQPKTILKSSGGIRRLRNWLTMTFSR